MRARVVATGLALVAVAGCAPPAAPRPSPVPSFQVREAALENGFVTVRVELPRDAAGPVPAVISLLGEGEALRGLGLAAVTYEPQWEKLRGLAPTPAAAPPARTWGKWLLASPAPEVIGRGYFALVAGDAEVHVPRVLDWLATLPGIDPTRIGIAGISTNGFKALQAVAHDRRLAAAVAVGACGDYHDFLARSSLALNGEEPLALAPDYARWLRAREPIRHPRRFVHAAVLLVNGEQDPVVPASCAVTTARAFARAYRAAGVPERFRAVLVEGGGHDLGAEARHQTLAWLYRWLVAGRSGYGRRRCP